MRETLLHVEVIVGELALIPTPSPQHGHPSAAASSSSPILPVVAVQVCNGPVLHVPFCDKSNHQYHDRQDGDEHNSQRHEVAKTCNSEEGRFVFQRGKSCLFTLPGRDRGNQDGRVEISVLNELHDPPSVYGRCEAQLKEWSGSRRNQTLTGKLAVFNDREEIVSYLTVFVSCRDVGEDVALQIQSQSFRDSKKQALSHSTVNINAVSADGHVNQNLKPDIIRNVSVISHNHFQELEVYPKAPNSFPSEKMEVEHIPSDQIAFMIKELYKSKKEEISKEAVQSPQVETNLSNESHQNFPLIRIRKNSQGEKMWNEKMQKLGGDSEALSHTQKDWRSRSYACTSTSSSSDGEGSVRVNAKGKSSHKATSSPSYELCNGSSSSLVSFKSSRGSMSNVSSLRRPKGWLRSTPIAPTPRAVSHPKLNRTHFLRRANMDTQLAHQLQVEVDYQVKRRLKQIDEGSKAQLEKMQRVKVRKGGHDQILQSHSVGCQTVGLFQDNSFSPQLVEKTSVTSTFHAVQNHHDGEKSEVGNNEMSNASSSSSSRVKPKVLQKNLTFEIDVPERDEDSHASTRYKADLDVPVQVQLGDATYRKTDHQSMSGSRLVNTGAQTNTPYSTATLESLPATSSGDSKQKSPQDVASSFHDASVRDGEKKWNMLSSVDMTREPSNDTGQTYTIYDNLSRVIQSSQEDASGEGYSQNSEYLSARSSNKTNADSCHSNHRCKRTAKSSQSSSKASKRSLEVYKEILKGKQADSLTRAGSQLVKPQEYSSTPEEVISVDASYQSCSLGSVKAEEVEEADSVSEVFSLPSEENSIPHVTGDYSGYGSSILSSYSHPEEDSIPMLTNTSMSAPQPLRNRIITAGGQSFTSESMGLLKSVKPVSSASEIYSYSGAHVGLSESSSNSRAERNWQFTNARKQKNEGEGQNMGMVKSDIGSSVSDISARIAALLVPKNLSVARINTDSVSSYIPSDLCNTMSSLSDMSQD